MINKLQGSSLDETPDRPSLSTAELWEHFRQVEAALVHEFFEREEVVRLALLTWLSETNMVLIGPPGTGKTALIHALTAHLGQRTFARLMHSHMRPAELFGEYSLLALAEDKRRRVATGDEIQCAEVAFLDEIFNPPPGLLNVLLDILSPGVRTFEGSKTNIHTVFGASNQYPQGLGSGKPDEQGVEALFDRFLVRMHVGPIQSDRAWLQLTGAAGASPAVEERESLTGWGAAELRDDARQKANVVTFSRPALMALLQIRQSLQGGGHYVSDRRWKQALQLCRFQVVLRGASEARPSDLTILRHVLWTLPEHSREIQQIVLSATNPAEALAVARLHEFTEQVDHIYASTQEGEERETLLLNLTEKVDKSIKEVTALLREAAEAPEECHRVLRELTEFKGRVARRVLNALRPTDPFGDLIDSLRRADA